ncbi:hypothetical protein REPUB_Repub06bG0124700 [Reevesia pubescens]
MWCLLKAYQFRCLVLFFLFFQANLPSASSSSVTQLCSPDEAVALILFKSSFSIFEDYKNNLEDCKGASIKSHPKTDSWKEGTDCCEWDGVTCDNGKGQVIGLDLSCSWLYGSFPSNSSLFHLSHLQKLNLALNNFNFSNMSSEFGRFASLVYLNLSSTSFSGKVPSQISHLSKLVSLDLSGNDYQPLDEHSLEVLVQNLTEVRHLFLDGIDMSSINPDVFMNLSFSLRSLSLRACELGGKFPKNIFHLPKLKLLKLGHNENLSLNLPRFNQSSHLEVLDLSYMSFSREWVDWIANLQSLKCLDLSGNTFFGGFPDSITNLFSLEQLDASGADFSGGGLPDSIGNLVSLKHLKLLDSNLSGSIPRSLGRLSQISYLELSNNYFSGQIPSSLTNLTHLEFINFQYNQLEGSIPDEVTAFPNLTYLDLSFNLLNGTLPSWLYTASSLEYIFLSNNRLTGPVKEFQYKSIKVISFESNKLQGPIPFSIAHLVNLTSLYLSSNNLTGTVGFGMFSKLQNLRELDLSSNSLSLNSSGTSTDYTLPNLTTVYLSSCNVNEFPQFLRGSESLLALDLSHNRIYGKIPKWMWDVGKDSLSYLNLSHNSLTKVEQLPWKEMFYLDLSSNLIHGDLPIPPSTTNVFLISNNTLSGEISSLICNLSNLEILDLSHNNLAGIIPQCFGNLSKRALMMNLGMNKFYGIIPPTFAKGCQLSNLNLNGNQLEGPLTRSIINCRGLEVLDLGNNKINDTFPHWLGSLPQLQVLVLRSNQLHGSLHDTRSGLSFSKIQIFDLSSNHFTGSLPVRYVTNFKSMINLIKDESAMSYMGVVDRSNGIFYSYSVGITIKGQELELVKIFTMLTSIDLSNNKFEGEVPKVIGKLNSLKGLNLSHNQLSGCIPTSAGNLTNLEWLDLSSNKLVGKIPDSLLDVTSLAFLNLSENQLDGRIPQGKQFNTFGNDSYEGNMGLCGFPVSKGCNEPPPPPILLEDGSKSSIAFGWKVVVIGYGCGVIFGLAMGYVVFQTGKPKWFVTLVEDHHHKRRKISKISNRRGGGRRM